MSLTDRLLNVTLLGAEWVLWLLVGLSMMWIAYLQSFGTQQGRKPRPPGQGDVAPRL